MRLGCLMAAVLLGTAANAAALVAGEAAQGRRVAIVGMSKGAVDAVEAIAANARPSGIVFVSGIHARIIATLGMPERLPATLVDV